MEAITTLKTPFLEGATSMNSYQKSSSTSKTTLNTYQFNPKEISQVNITLCKGKISISSTASSFKDFQARINATKNLRGFIAKIDVYDKNFKIIESKKFTNLKKLKSYYKTKELLNMII